MTTRKRLTDAAVNAAKADVVDAVVPGLLLRVRPSGSKSFALLARYPGTPNPTRRTIARVGVLSIAEARDKARSWLDLISRGIDPAEQIERAKAEADRKRHDTIAALAEVYIQSAVKGPRFPDKPRMRKWEQTEQNIRDILVPLFGERPIAELTPAEVSTALRQIEHLGTDHALVKLKARRKLRRPEREAKPAPEMARSLFGYLDNMLRWAADSGEYGIDTSPLQRVNKLKRFGPLTSRTRYLDEVEIGHAWRAAGSLRSPYRQMYRMLMLTGLRLSEVREADWREFNIPGKEWTIPAERMKGREDRAKAHTVPLTAHMLAVLKEVPRGPRGPFVFSLDGGLSPICERGNFKRMLDAAIATNTQVPDSKVPHFTNHDLRRTLRTLGPKEVGISPVVGEKMLAHALPGVGGIYDRGDYLDERRKAHVRWGEFLLDCASKASKVVRLRKAA